MRLRFLRLLAFFAIGPHLVSAQTSCYITVNQSQTIQPAAKKLLGTSFDARSSVDYDPNAGIVPVGYYDPTSGDLLPEVQPWWEGFPMATARYPGNPVILNWNWSYTIGPLSGRTAQPMGVNGTLSQTLVFGFDEFMDMTLEHGMPYSDVQIMVNIQPSVGQPNPATLAADWVEYCNSPNNGSNPRGGTDWAALRASYGHENPYNIQIWNIGNEPWSQNDCCQNNPALYISIADPIIDSMKNVDPSIHITLPAVGNGSSAWNQALINSPILAGEFYGLSPHAFYDEDPNTTNPTVAQVQTLLSNLTSVAASHNLKVIVGDHAHNAPSADPDKAMRWEGALATANFLLMVSQIGNIELANFWIYGLPVASWHPIRKNANGTYTRMAAAQLYTVFNPAFLDQSLQTTLADSTGNQVPSIRAAAFKTNDGSAARVIVANIHSSTDRKVVPPVLSGLNLQAVKLLSAALSADTFMTTTPAPLPDGKYLAPHSGVLIFEYGSSAAAVSLSAWNAHKKLKNNVLEWRTEGERGISHFEVERSGSGFSFERIGGDIASANSEGPHDYSFVDQQPELGGNYYRLRTVDLEGTFEYSKVLFLGGENTSLCLKVSPNPASDQVILTCADPSFFPETITILNTLGEQVLTSGIWEEGECRIVVQGLPAGTYFVRAEGNGGAAMGWFVK